MIDAGAVLDQVPSHVDVVIDDGFQQGRLLVFVFGVHVGTSLKTKTQMDGKKSISTSAGRKAGQQHIPQ